MIIKKNTWHYWLNSKIHNSCQLSYMNSICEYVRATMVSVFVSAVILTCVVGFTFLATLPFVGIFVEFSEPFIAMQIIGTGCYVLGIVLGIIFGSLKLIDKAVRKFKKRPKKEKEPGIFKEYYRAHKSKICPMIEFK